MNSIKKWICVFSSMSLICGGTTMAAEAREQLPDTLRLSQSVYYDPILDQNGELAISFTTSYLHLADTDHPVLSASLDEVNADIQAHCMEYLNPMIEDVGTYGMTSDYAWILSAEPSTVRADEAILSFTEGIESYSGGAHGYYELIGYTLDAESGKRLSLRDITTDYDLLYQTAIQRLHETYNNPDFFLGDPDETVRQEFYVEENQQWYLGTDCLTLFYNPYVLGSYAAGRFIVDIPFADYPDLFLEQYTYSGRDSVRWVYPYDNGSDSYQKDFNGNGAEDYLKLTQNYDPEDYQRSELILNWNGAELNLGEGYSFRNAFICQGGNQYLYVDMGVENDYRIMKAVDLNGSVPALLAEYSNLGFGVQSIRNPSQLYLTSKVDCLGSYSGTRLYHIGEDGMLYEDETEYRLYNTVSNDGLESILDLQVYGCDAAGNRQDSLYYPAGTIYYPYATDKETYMQAVLEDGTFVIIPLEKPESYHFTINGVNEQDCFETLPYAG